LFTAIALSLTVSAASQGDNAADVISAKLSAAGASSVQQWIDTELCGNAGSGSEWFAFSLSRYGNYDFSGYISALEKYIEKNEIAGAVTQQKYAFVLSALGAKNDFTASAVDRTAGNQGIMSLVFALHLITNGAESELYDADAIISDILSLKLSDGGWTLRGENADVDVTAMTVTALAPYIENSNDVYKAVSEALDIISERQLASGGFISYGVENPESAAQVTVALCTLGIDPENDERFIKNGNSPIDAMLSFKLENGLFSHTAGGNANNAATYQVLYALIAYERFEASLSPLFLFKDDIGSGFEQNPDISVPQGKAPRNILKIYLSAAAALISVVGCVIIIVMKKRRSHIATIIIAGVFIILALNFIDISSAEEYKSNITAEKSDIAGTVTMSVDCLTVVGKISDAYIPKNGIILDVTAFAFEEGETAFDILKEASAKYGFALEYSGGNASPYIEGISYLYEFDHGDLSGWQFFVNGESASVGCGDYKLSDGDAIVWKYTCDMGKDIILD